MDTKRILFLDFDGVLNSDEYEATFIRRLLIADPDSLDPKCVALIQSLLNVFPNLFIVVSSTWRNHYSLEELKVILQNKGLKTVNRLLGVTPYLPNSPRSEEIKAWLDSHPEIIQYAIVDDEPNSLQPLKDRLVTTNPESGLKHQDINELVLKLAK